MTNTEQIAYACRKIVLSAINVAIWNAQFLVTNKYATQLEKQTLNRLISYLEGFQTRLYMRKDKAQVALQKEGIEASAEFSSDVLLICESVHCDGYAEFLERVEGLQEEINAKHIK